MAKNITRKIDNKEITDLELEKIVNFSLDGAPQILSEAEIEDRQMTLSEKQKFEEDWARIWWSVESISVDDANMTL